MTIKVIGVGNRFRRDDGVGPAVVDLLSDALPKDVEAEIRQCDPADLIDAWRDACAVVIVDASAPAGQPGRIVRIDMKTDAPAPEAPASTHGFGLAEALALAQALGAAPERAIVYAVEGADFGHGAGLSEEVRARLPALANTVCAELRALGAVAQKERSNA